MRYNTTSVFPTSADPYQIVGEPRVRDLADLEEYLALLNAGNYSSAKDKINDSEVGTVSADLLNMIQNRSGNTQQYTRENPLAPKYKLCYRNLSEVTSSSVKAVWVSDYAE